MKKEQIKSVFIALVLGIFLYFGERILFSWSSPVALFFASHFLEPGVRDTTGIIVLSLFMTFLCAILVSIAAAAVLRVTVHYKSMTFPLISAAMCVSISYLWVILEFRTVFDSNNFESLAQRILRPIVVIAVFLIISRILLKMNKRGRKN